jgi:hypothetical protein
MKRRVLDLLRRAAPSRIGSAGRSFGGRWRADRDQFCEGRQNAAVIGECLRLGATNSRGAACSLRGFNTMFQNLPMEFRGRFEVSFSRAIQLFVPKLL